MSEDRAAEPLPHRVSNEHLEPQLATPWSAGSGTPFVAFEGPDVDTSGDEPDAPVGKHFPRTAAAFHEGTERGRAATED